VESREEPIPKQVPAGRQLREIPIVLAFRTGHRQQPGDRGQFLHRVTTTFEAQANRELRDEEFRFESPRD